MRIPNEEHLLASESVESRSWLAIQPAESVVSGTVAYPLRLPNSPVRALQHAYLAVLEKANDAPSVLSRLRRQFRQQGQTAAQDGTPIQRIFGVVRQTVQTAVTGSGPDPEVAASCEIVLQAVEAAVQGYLQEQARRDGLDAHTHDDALQILEDERNRLARELHDETGQILTATLFKIDTCIRDLPTDRGEITAQLQDIRQTLVAATRDLHRLVYSLRPPMLSELGLVPTLHWLVHEFETQYQVPARFSAPKGSRLPEAVEMAIFRLVQEALTNVARHASARSVQVELILEPRRVICVVQDDGRGFDANRVLTTEVPRLGLLGMRERVRQLGGSLIITSAPDRGTTVRATLPYAGGRSG
ncbi:MAG: sensor histidine kinase [Chloroflexota bacterium]